MLTTANGWQLVAGKWGHGAAWQLRNELWVMLATGNYSENVPDRLWELLYFCRACSLKTLNYLERWIVKNTIGFRVSEWDRASEIGMITPDISDAEYDAGTLAEQRARDERDKESSRGTERRVKQGSLGYIGIDLHKRTGRYRARIRLNRTLVHLGYFSTPEEAAQVYDEAALFYLGQHAVVNDPSSMTAWVARGQGASGGF